MSILIPLKKSAQFLSLFLLGSLWAFEKQTNDFLSKLESFDSYLINLNLDSKKVKKANTEELQSEICKKNDELKNFASEGVSREEIATFELYANGESLRAANEIVVSEARVPEGLTVNFYQQRQNQIPRILRPLDKITGKSRSRQDLRDHFDKLHLSQRKTLAYLQLLAKKCDQFKTKEGTYDFQQKRSVLAFLKRVAKDQSVARAEQNSRFRRAH